MKDPIYDELHSGFWGIKYAPTFAQGWVISGKGVMTPQEYIGPLAKVD